MPAGHAHARAHGASHASAARQQAAANLCGILQLQLGCCVSSVEF